MPALPARWQRRDWRLQLRMAALAAVASAAVALEPWTQEAPGMGYIRPIPKYLIPWAIIGAIGLAAADKTRRAWRRLRRIPAPPQP